MRLFTKLLLSTIITFGLYACAENSKTTGTDADSTTGTVEENNQNTDETDSSKTEDANVPNEDEERNAVMEQQLLGSWGDKENVSEFTFSEGNAFRQITPVPVIKGTYKVVGDILTIEGIKTVEGVDEDTEKVNDKYKIEQITERKILKLKDLSNDATHTLRYGEKAY